MKRILSILFSLPRRAVDYVIGWKFLNKLISEKKDNEIYLILGAVMGDNLYSLAYTYALRRKYPEKRIVVFGSEKNAALIKTYSSYIDEFRLQGVNERDYASMLIKGEQLKRALANDIIVPIPLYYRYLRKSENIGTLYLLRKFIFMLPDDSPVTYHQIRRVPVRAINNFEAIKHRTVIVNSGYLDRKYNENYASSVYGPICQILLSAGFEVFTNTAPGSQPLKGTRSLQCSIEELYSIACEIPLVVSRRSGVLDLLVPSGINIFAVYDTDIFFKYFPLREWQGTGKVYEISIRAEDIAMKLQAFLDELKQEGRIS